MSAKRKVRRGVVMLAIAASLTLVLSSCSSDSSGTAKMPGHHGATTVAYAPTKAQTEFHDAMRVLWEQHVAWTRMAIVDFAAGSKGFDATAARLMKNQDDIGNAIKPYYGDTAGAALTTLLKAHIAIAVDVLKAAKAGDTKGLAKANASWYKNSDEIADFLAKANPASWPQAGMRTMMKTHLDQTLAEASEQLTGKFADSAATYDEVEAHMTEMADMLSAGIVKAFPDKFK